VERRVDGECKKRFCFFRRDINKKTPVVDEAELGGIEPVEQS
jgi:hypothetical protein